MSDAADIQRDLELAATETDAATVAAREIQKNIHTAIPGIIQSFDAGKQTATVKPAIKRIWVDNGPMDLPDCVDCPVQFPRGGFGVLTFPVTAGDECLLVFSERAIDNWYSSGGAQEPSEYRLHDLSDGFAIVGVSSLGKVIKDFATDAVEIRTLDGKTRIRLEAGMAYVGGKDGAVKMILGETYRTAETQMDQAIASALPAVVAALAAIPASTVEFAAFVALYPTIAAFFAALGTFLGGAWLPALQAFEGQAPAFLATKGKVV
jgi:protein gp138